MTATVASGSLSGEIILHSVTTNLSSNFGHGNNQVQYGFIQNKVDKEIFNYLT